MHGKGLCHAKKLLRVVVTAITTGWLIKKAMPREVTHEEKTH